MPSTSANPLGTPEYHLQFIRRAYAKNANLLNEYGRRRAKTQPPPADKNVSPDVPVDVEVTPSSSNALPLSHYNAGSWSPHNNHSAQATTGSRPIGSPIMTHPTAVPVHFTTGHTQTVNNVHVGSSPLPEKLEYLWNIVVPSPFVPPDLNDDKTRTVVSRLLKFGRGEVSTEEAQQLVQDISLEDIRSVGWSIACDGVIGEEHMRASLLMWSASIGNMKNFPHTLRQANQLAHEIRMSAMGLFRQIWMHNEYNNGSAKIDEKRQYMSGSMGLLYKFKFLTLQDIRLCIELLAMDLTCEAKVTALFRLIVYTDTLICGSSNQHYMRGMIRHISGFMQLQSQYWYDQDALGRVTKVVQNTIDLVNKWLEEQQVMA
ncbi:unnamed protein product [Somion occarium]|uniref:Uncharacterized protein n=1 Tax=Somion occarium TaxID=3059160 RepID=A0ABP1DT41_9APHY